MATKAFDDVIHNAYERAIYNYSIRTKPVLWTHFQLWLSATIGLGLEQYDQLTEENRVKILEAFLKDTLIPERALKGMSQGSTRD